MKVEKYANLPDSMEEGDLLKMFDLFLQEAKDDPDISGCLISLNELADRQWHTYSLLRSDVRKKIDKYVSGHVKDNLTQSDYNYLCSIISTLGLIDSYKALRKIYKKIKDKKSKSWIKHSLDEWGSSVEDPYSGIR